MREIFTVIDHNDEDNRFRIDGDELAERMADKEHENLERVFKFRDRDTKREYEVPESELGEFRRMSQGAAIEPVRRIAMYDGRSKRDGRKDSVVDFADDRAARHFEVPESELEDFGKFAKSSSWYQTDRDETKRLVSSRGYQPESPFVAGMRKFGEQAAVTGKRLGAEAGVGILQGAAKIGALGGTVANAVSPGSGDKLIDANDVMGQVHNDVAEAFQPEESGNAIADKAQQMAFGAVNSIGQQLGARAVTLGIGGGLTGKAAEGVRGAVVAGSYGNERGIEIYRQAKEAGKSDAAAFGLAGVGAVVETGLEYVGQLFGGGKAAKEAIEGVRGLVGETLAKHIGKEIAEESATEFAQEYLGHLIDEIAKSPEKWHDVLKSGQVQKDALEAGISAAGSAVMSVGAMQGPNAVGGMAAERNAADLEAGARTVEHGGHAQYRTKAQHEGAKQALATDEGLNSWAMHHHDEAETLAKKDRISRKDAEAAGLPKMTENERDAFLGRLKERMNGREENGRKDSGPAVEYLESVLLDVNEALAEEGLSTASRNRLMERKEMVTKQIEEFRSRGTEGRKSAEDLAAEENGGRVSKLETADQLKAEAQRAEAEAQRNPSKENIDFANEVRRDLYVYEALQQRSEKSGRLKGAVPSVALDDGRVFGALDKVEPGAYQKDGETVIVNNPGQTAAEVFMPGLREDVEARLAAREQNAMKAADQKAETERHREREKDIEAAFANDDAEKAKAEGELAAQRERRETDEAQARRGERVQKVLDKFDGDMDAAAIADEDGFVRRNADLFGQFQKAVEDNNPGKAEEIANKLRKKLRAERKHEAPERRARRAEESAAEEKARREERRQRAWELVAKQQAEYNEARAREKAAEEAQEQAERKADEEKAAKEEAARKEAEALEQQRQRRESDAEGQEKGARLQKLQNRFDRDVDAANLADRDGFVKRNGGLFEQMEQSIADNNPGKFEEVANKLRKRLRAERKNKAPKVSPPEDVTQRETSEAAPVETDEAEQKPVEQGTSPEETAQPAVAKAEDYDAPEAKTKWMDDNPDAAKNIIRDAQKHGGVPGAGVMKKAGLPDMTREQRVSFGKHLREEAGRRREAAEKLERDVEEKTSLRAYEDEGHEVEAAAIGTGLPIDDKALGNYLKALSAWRLAISHGGTKFSAPNGKTDFATGRNKPLYSQFAKGDTAVNDRINTMLDGMTADDIRKMRDAMGKGSYSHGGTENLAAALAENLGGKDSEAQMTNAEALDRIILAWDSYQQWKAEREERIRKGEPVSDEEVHAREEEEEEQKAIQDEADAIAGESEGGDDSFDFTLDGGTEEDAKAENAARRKGKQPEKSASQSEAVNIQPEWDLGQDQSDLFHPIEDPDAPFQRESETRSDKLKDPDFVKWCKKHGNVIPTDGARERYDRQMAKGAVDVVKRWLKGVKVRYENNAARDADIKTEDRAMIRAGEYARWNKTLDDYEAGNMPPNSHAVVFEHTPVVLQRIGAPDLPVTLNKDVIDKISGIVKTSMGEQHKVPVSELRNLQIELDNPIAIFDSRTQRDALVVLTRIIDNQNNERAVVALHLDKTSGAIHVNDIASVYGKDKQSIENWTAWNLLRYVNKQARKASAKWFQLPSDSDLRASGVLTEKDFSADQLGIIIPQPNSNVNGNPKNSGNVTDPNVRNLYGNGGEIIGKYNKRTKEVTLYPGANASTVAHEIGWHATYDYAENLAKSTDPQEAARGKKLLDKLRDFAKSAPPAIVGEVMSRYGTNLPADVLLDEIGAAHFTERELAKIKDLAERQAARKWYQKAWDACKDAYKSMLEHMGRNKVDLNAIDAMTPEQVVDFLADEMAKGRNLATVQAGEIDMDAKETERDKYMRKQKDYLRPVMWLQDQINKVAGSRQSTLYRDMRLAPGRQQKAVNEVDDFVAGVAERCKKADITLAELDEYLYAKGAYERNAKILARNGKLDGSAMPTDVALDIIDRYEKSSKGAELKAIQREVMKFQDKGLQRRVDAGLISAAFADQLRAEEPNHVPMKTRFDENGDFIGYDSNASFARPEWQKAKGRTNVGGAVLSWICQEYLDAHQRGIDNEIRQDLVGAIAAHPEIGTVEKVDQNFKEHEARRERNGRPEGTPNLLLVRRDGETYAIRLNGEHGVAVARAMTKRGNLSMPRIVQQTMRLWASTATELSPTFGLRNLLGDNASVMGINIGENGIIKGTAQNIMHIGRMASSLNTVYRYARTGEIKGRDAALLQRYIDAGGLIGGIGNEGYGRGKEGAEGGEAVSNAFGIIEGDTAFIRAWRSGKRDIKAVAKHLFGWVDYFNKTSELVTRFADFKAQVKKGKSDEDAALHAREITVDFNQRGEWTGVTNTLYMFSNSTLGATIREMKAIGGRRGLELAGFMMGLGVLEALVEYKLNPDDDDREKEGKAVTEDVSEYTRANSIMTRVGDRVYRAPMHGGPLSFLKYAGNCMTRWALGKMKRDEVGSELGGELAGIAMRYLGLGDLPGDKLTAFVPTIFQPWVQMATNRDFKGSPLENRPIDENLPMAHQGRDSTAEPYKWIATWLNDELGGGNEGRKGKLFGKMSTDVSPEVVKLFTESIGKNVLKDVSNTITVIDSFAGGELPDVDKTPVVRDYVRKVSNDHRYVQSKEKVSALSTEFRELLKVGKYDEATEVVRRSALVAKEPASAMRKLRSNIEEVRDAERHAVAKGQREQLSEVRHKLQAIYLQLAKNNIND